MSINPVTWLVAFAAMFLLDVAWVLYMRAANEHRPGAAALWAGVLHAFGVLTVITYVEDHRYLTATMAGTLAGTFAVVWWNRRKASPCSR